MHIKADITPAGRMIVKYISILGSTGSIGTQTLDVVRKNNDIKVVALSAGKNVELMEKQVREFKPVFVSMADENTVKELKLRLADISGI